ncbi:MAG: hypothetical protein ACRC6V_03710 [Bacteroidales bacterium]
MIEHYLKYIPEEEHKDFLSCFTYQTVNTLNELMQLDPEVITNLCELRAACSHGLGAKAFVTDVGDDCYQVGVLGIINSILPSTTKVLPVYTKLPAVVGKPILQLFVAKDLENVEKEND